jgi:hypothetical protein
MLYETIGKEIGELVDLKNKMYGDSFNKSGDILKILYPNGIIPEQYDDLLFITRIVDKLFRIATDKKALGESPVKDMAGYCILCVERNERSDGSPGNVPT